MEPFEAIKHKNAPAFFTPKSCKLRPQSDNIGSVKAKKVLSPPAVGGAGRAVMVKKQMRQVMLPTAGLRVQQQNPFKTLGNTISPPMSPQSPPLGSTMLPLSLTVFKSPKKAPDLSPTSPALERPPRNDGCTILELTPSQRSVPNLKKLDLDKAVPDFTDTPVRTPRFCIPATLEVRQSAGPQVIHNFATNPDHAEAGVDQALCYSVWAHTTEVFYEGGLPTIDCEGTLFFTPSYHFGGTTLVTVTLSDNAAVHDGTVKTSPPLTLKLMVVPGAVNVKKPKDWRSQTSRQNMTVAMLSAVEDEQPSGWIFPPGNIHFLRERTRIKGHQDKSLRKLLGTSSLEIIFGHRYTSLCQGEDIDLTPESEKAALERMAESKGLEAVPHLQQLAKIYSSWGGVVNTSKCVKVLRRVIDTFASDVGIGDQESTVDTAPPMQRSKSISGEPTDELTLRQEKYALAILELAYYHVSCMAYRDARKVLEKAVVVFESLHGIDHPLCAKAYLFLAECLAYEHRHNRACEVAKMAASSSCLVFSTSDVRTIDSLHMFAYCMRQSNVLKHKEEGLRKHKDAHELLLKSGDRTPHIVESHLFLADAHREMGEWKNAMSHAEAALQLAEAEHPQITGYAQMVMGGIYLVQSKYDEQGALSCLRKAAESVKRRTDMHRFTALKACLEVSQGDDIREGIEQLRSCENELANLVTPAHPLLCRVRSSLAGALLKKARSLTEREKHPRKKLLDECMHLLQQALQHEKQVAWDPQTAVTFELLGDLCFERSLYGDALSNYVSAKKCLNTSNLEVIGSPGNSGAMQRMYELHIETLLLTGVPAGPEMVAEYEEMVEKVQRAFGEWDGHTVYPILNLAEVCYVVGEYDMAHRHFAKALAIVDSQNMHFLLGNLFKPSSQLKQAEVQERNRLAAERMTPVQCSHLGMILSQIATVYEKQHMLKEAETSYVQTLAAYEIAGKAQSLGCCYALDGLARLLFVQGLYGDALSYFEKAYGIRYTVHGSHKEEIQLSLKNIHIVNARVCCLVNKTPHY